MTTEATTKWEYATIPAEKGLPALYIRFDGEQVQVSDTRPLPKPEGESIEDYIVALQKASEGLVNTSTDFTLHLGWHYGSPSAEAEMSIYGWRELNEGESARYYA
jgi:hypothetical protein